MIFGLRPYSAMKGSGSQWLLDVPEHWEVRRLKRVCRLAYGDALATEVRRPGHVAVFGSNGRVGLHDCANTRAPCVVIGRKGSFGKVNYSTEPVFAIDTTFFVDHRHTTADIRWLHYLLGLLGLDEVSKDSAIPGLDREEAYQRVVAVPPRAEQVATVHFLDHFDRRIRRYIRAKQKLIKLLEEQKQAIIDQAVTRGLDPTVRLKPSGVEWLGDVPEHWDVVLNQRIFKELIRPHNGESYVPLSLSQKDGLIATTELKERSLQTSTYDNWKVTLPGDIVVNRFKAHLGVFFESRLRGIVSFHYGVFAPRIKMVAKYFEHLFHTRPYRTIYAGRSNGMTVGLQNLSNQNFYGVRTLVPPLDEQARIVEYLDRATREADSAMMRLRREADLLKEYRTRLIADVVTGKLDVREAVTRLPVEADEPDASSDVDEDIEAVDPLDEELESVLEEVEA